MEHNDFMGCRIINYGAHKRYISMLWQLLKYHKSATDMLRVWNCTYWKMHRKEKNTYWSYFDLMHIMFVHQNLSHGAPNDVVWGPVLLACEHDILYIFEKSATYLMNIHLQKREKRKWNFVMTDIKNLVRW